MKRTIILTTLMGLLFASNVVAQEESSEKDYLPKSGDFSLGFDLNPLINFAGNIFNNTSDQTLDEIGGEPVSIISTTAITQPTVSFVGRYMLRNDLAIRANIGVMVTSETASSYVQDDASVALDPLSAVKVTDSAKSAEQGGSIVIALEKRLGNRRVQGVFSAGLVYGFATGSTKYEYGNAITEINQAPSIAYTSNYSSTVSSVMSNARLVESYIDGAHSLGIATSAGVEYFVAPKISLGLEVNIIAVYGVTTGTYQVYEGYNSFEKCVTTHTELITPRTSSFIFGTENIGGNLNLNFYF